MVVKKNGKKKNNKLKVTLVALIGILVAALALCVVFLAINTQVNDRIMNNANALEGVKINDVDISGMDRDEALKATENVQSDLLSKVNITFTVEGEEYNYTAEQLGITTDYEEMIDKALAYGNTGSLEERKQAIEKAKSEGVSFAVTITPDKDKLEAALLPLKSTLDTQPVDASCVFTPWGHTSDGTPYDQDQKEMVEAAANNKQWSRPDLVRLSDSEMPNKLRFKYWRNDKYIADYIPDDAKISRFVYSEGTPGRSVDMEAVVDSIMAQLESGEYSTITAPVETVEPQVTVESLKKTTQLVSSWTSSYSNHSSYNRNWNVTKMSAIINGVVIQPGEEWSINKQAGNRTSAAGWKDAAGIVGGGFVDQPGGGVCQISSTTYNAAIRSALEIADSSHHSIPSDYIPFGLDATISSGGPDLKLKNPYNTPVYIVSYIDPKAKTATVEVYGQPVVDDKYGEVILDFSFKDGGTFGTAGMNFLYNQTKAPDGTKIAAGKSYEYAKARVGRKVQTFIHYISLDGEELAVDDFHSYSWNPQNGKTYVNGPDPATVTPTPPPVTTTTPPPVTTTPPPVTTTPPPVTTTPPPEEKSLGFMKHKN
jgi:hypothetical protein